MYYKPYEPKADDVFRFAQFVHAETRQRGDEVSFKVCPYCKSAKKDNLYKFSINIRTGVFLCMRDGCKARGNMITLARDFDFSLGNEVDEYYKPQKKFKTFKAPKEPIVPKTPAVKYLEGRGISKSVAEKYQITTMKGRDNILAFPFLHKGEICMIKYRKMDFDPAKDSAKEWSEKGGKPILFGMEQCNLENKTLICTEGQLDSLSVAEAGFENAVSVPTGANGFTWVPYCWDWVRGFERIIVFGDHEKGRITLLDDIAKRFPCEVRHVREEDYKDCKDANDILRKYGIAQVRKCIENAIPVPVSRVIKLSTVKSVDLFKMPKLQTGIRQQDALLFGGLPFGYVHIVTGRRGAGKSTFANQLIVKAVEQGYTSFIYSGELQNDRLQAWIDFQIAGRKHILENTNEDGSPHRFISNANRELIHRWYDEKLFIYDNTVVRNEREDLLKTIEDSIRQYNVKVILLDNLMIALDLDAKQGTDKYERQSRFVKNLVLLAQRYDVMVLLVAHRRKGGYDAEDMSDEVSGSSDITNLAGVVMSYDRLSKSDIEKGKGKEIDRVLITSKNRLFGKVNFKGFVLAYDETSKRVYGQGDDVNYQFAWDGGEEHGDGDETPFD